MVGALMRSQSGLSVRKDLIKSFEISSTTDEDSGLDAVA
jgi:hypothetical protein